MIKKIALSLFLSLALLATTGLPAAQAITGGKPAASPYSFMGSLQRLDSPRPDLHVCGVELVAPRWALTAGHCTRGPADVYGTPTDGHPFDWKVRFGSTRVGSGGALVRVVRFTQLNNAYFEDDIALLRLARPVKLAPVPIADSIPEPGTPVRILGWGETCRRSIAPRCTPEHLREADTVVQPEETCEAGDGNLCIGSRDGRVAPQNFDSGGPALVMQEGRWQLIGTVEGGGSDLPAIYTEVVRHRGWIDARISSKVPVPADTPFLSDALAGTAQLGGACSGSIIHTAESRPSDPAMLLTAGHCVQPMPLRHRAVVDRPYREYVYLKDRHGQTIVRASTEKVSYATMSGTDVAVLSLDVTYAGLARAGVHPFALAATGPRPGGSVEVRSAISGQSWTCNVAAIVPELLEGGYRTFDAFRYRTAHGCNGRHYNGRLYEGPSHGDSGAPLVDPKTGLIVGIHATGNDDGKHCIPDSPCEVDGHGPPLSVEGRQYGDGVAILLPCLASGSRIVLSRPGCRLTRRGAR